MAKKKKIRRMRAEIPIENIKQGPLRHKNGLTPLLEELARELFLKVGHFVNSTFEEWELGFMRDTHPWREILIWEIIARTFELYIAKYPEAANNEQIVGTIAAISTGQTPDSKMANELHGLFVEACRKQWIAPPGKAFEFPEDEAVVLQFEDIVDEWPTIEILDLSSTSKVWLKRKAALKSRRKKEFWRIPLRGYFIATQPLTQPIFRTTPARSARRM